MTTYPGAQPCKAKRCVHRVKMTDYCAKCVRLLAELRRYEGPLVMGT